MKVLHIIAHILLWVGGLNWGLVGLAMLVSPSSNWNVVHMVVGAWPMVEAIVYVLVGLSAIWAIIGHWKDCRTCSA